MIGITIDHGMTRSEVTAAMALYYSVSSGNLNAVFGNGVPDEAISLARETMMTIAWLYFGDHLSHPFIRIGIRSLLEHRHDVLVHDVSAEKAKTEYRHVHIPMDLNVTGLKSAANKLKYLCLLILSAGFLIIRRPCVVIVTMAHMAPVAIFAKHAVGSRIVYYPFELLGEQTGHVNHFWKILERYFIASSIDALITQNDRRAEIYLKERGSRVEPVIVHNYKPAAKGALRPGQLRSLLGLNKKERIVLYEGLLVHGRWLDELIQSARYLGENTFLTLMGETTPWWEKNGKHLLEDPELSNRVKIAPFVPHDRLLEFVADADAGIIIYDDSSRNNYLCEPGKLSDYVRAGIPVVAPDFPTIGPVIRRYQIGATFSEPNPAKIAEAIKTVLDSPKPAWAAGLERASRELVWETQENTFLKAISGF